MQWTRHRHLPTPLGEVRLVRTEHGLSGVWFCQAHRHAPAAALHPAGADDLQDPLLHAACAQLQGYFADPAHPTPTMDLPLDLSAGTEFQQTVWRALLALPPGQWSTYGAIAQAIGRPQAARAVGAAVGRNPIGILVPCHRVLGSQGQLTGYAGGLWRKKALLEHEGLGPF